MNINGKTLLQDAPIANMQTEKVKYLGTSHGLSEAGYDITIAQTVQFFPPNFDLFSQFIMSPDFKDLGPISKRMVSEALYGFIKITDRHGKTTKTIGRFVLASAVEYFQMPLHLVATVKDKSSWARKGLSVFNTVAEPGWNGYLTLELVFNGSEPVTIEAGQGIAQVLFTQLSDLGDYGAGKYQNQENEPVQSRS